MLPELGGSMEDGLLDRFLFAYPHHSSTDLSEIEMEPGTEEGFARLYDSLCSLRMVEDVATGLYRPERHADVPRGQKALQGDPRRDR